MALIISATFFLLSCSDDDNIVDYPISFTFSDINFDPSSYFVVDGTTPVEIAAAGTFTQFEGQLMEDLSIANLDFLFPFSGFVLLNETEIQVSLTDQSLDTVLNYTQTENKIQIILDEGTNEILELEYDEEDAILKYCIQSYFHSFNNSQNMLDYSPLDIAPCSTPVASEFATNIIQDNALMNNDSIALNYAWLVFDWSVDILLWIEEILLL